MILLSFILLQNTLSRAPTLTAERLYYGAEELINCKEERGIYDNILPKVGNRAKGSHTWDIRVTPNDNILWEERQGGNIIDKYIHKQSYKAQKHAGSSAVSIYSHLSIYEQYKYS